MAITVHLRNPVARRMDPASSHAAAARITKSGWRDSQAFRVLIAVAQSPGGTSAEYGRLDGFDRYITARRLPDLEKLGLVRRGPERICKIAGHDAVSWWPTAAAYRLISAGQAPAIVNGQQPLF